MSSRATLKTKFQTADIPTQADFEDLIDSLAHTTENQAWPIGSVFVSVVATNPNTLLGYGTWAAIAAGKVLVGLDSGDTDFDTAEETGGAKTVASSAQTFGGDALATHQHAAVSAGTPSGTNAAESTHTHGVTSNVAVGDHASHTHDYTQVPNHTHPVNVTDPGHTHLTQRYPTATGASSGFTIDTSMSGTLADNTLPTKSGTTGITATTSDPTGGVATGTTAGPSATLSHSVTNNAVTSAAGSSHNHAFTGDALATHQHAAISAGTPSGTNTPGAATSVVQPYFVCYFWKRTA